MLILRILLSLLLVTLNLAVSSNALGETHIVSAFLESNGTETSQTLAYTYRPNKEDYAHSYVGFSFSGVQANKSLAPNDRSNIISYYLNIGYRANYLVSPYVELGLDLGDLFIDTIISGESEQVDVTASIGLVYNTKLLDVFVYYKHYSIKYAESDFDNKRIIKNSLSMPGIGIGLKF
jgi:hypothetical protein